MDPHFLHRTVSPKIQGSCFGITEIKFKCDYHNIANHLNNQKHSLK